MNILDIKNLTAKVNNNKIINGLNLKINAGEVHAIMGPNGAGKSSLASVIIGKDNYLVEEGEIIYNGENIVESSVDYRAKKGIFLGFQNPVEIPGVSVLNFLRTSVNEVRKYNGLDLIDTMDFLEILEKKAEELNICKKMIRRSVNECFSGGEKKKLEILQMALLNPKLIILDEIDSGLDIDALKVVANGVNKYRQSDSGVLLITHYQRLLDYIKPDYVHILANGKIIKSGDFSLAARLDKVGYDEFTNK